VPLMTPGRTAQQYRFFLDPRYSIDYWRAAKFEWRDQTSPDYRVFFLLDGTLDLAIAGHPEQVISPSVLLLDPSVTATGKGQLREVLAVNLAAQMVVDCALRMRLVSSETAVVFPRRLLRGEEKLSQLGQALAAEVAMEDVGREIVIAALIEQLLVHLLRHHSTMRRSSELELSRVGLIDRRIRRAAELMQARLDEDLTLKDIAAASYLSPFHFSRLFKKLTGTTPLAYLGSQRIARARLLLAQSDLSITQIAAQVGYGSGSHFTKAFRQATGLTPKQFRAAVISRA
ncbi:MAG TPA: helix-turn-helix transcriptional regulator, partial [Pyrinomonadaceae bacterium]|nr:helix-turn-helix transcriptional regulator [Pyrinomonadaceae bacterium]